LDPPLFSPATKADVGHDENITVGQMRTVVGERWASKLENLSREIYQTARAIAAERGIIIADTKFEFGLAMASDGTEKVILVDEVLTPDSSRFWAVDNHEPGQSPPSFDKQPLRDYLAGEKRAGRWDGNYPPPRLPREVIDATSARYIEIYRRLTGKSLYPDGAN
jgi:phosphoribosylaminoimidazole-succinocarboxamide synthase